MSNVCYCILNKILKFETSTSLHSVFIHNLYSVPTFLESGLYIRTICLFFLTNRSQFKFYFSFYYILFYYISLNALVCFDIILCLAYIKNLINN